MTRAVMVTHYAAIRALRKFEQAAIARAMKGSMHPDDWDGVEDDYKKARDHLKKFLPIKQ